MSGQLIGGGRSSTSAAMQERLHELVPCGAHTYARGSDQYPGGRASIIAETRDNEGSPAQALKVYARAIDSRSTRGLLRGRPVAPAPRALAAPRRLPDLPVARTR